MSEHDWSRYQALLAEQSTSDQAGHARACIGCWYDAHRDGALFPGDVLSSSLCQEHAASLPPSIQSPYSLL